MKKLIVEFAGTFILMFTVGNAVISLHPLAALAIGSALMIAVYAGGPVSGGHYNPAVSLAVWRRGKLSTEELPRYLASQLAGAIVAAWLVRYLQSPSITAYAKAAFEATSKAPPRTIATMLAELVWTTVLPYVVLQGATTKKSQGNSYYGLAIGFTVATGAVALGNVSGGVFNPAVFIGLCILGLKSWLSIFTFWIPQFLGGFLAAELFKRTTPDEE